MKSIKAKILLVVISGLMVMTGIISVIGVYMTHGIMHQDADRILKNLCQKEAAYINDIMGDIVKSAAVMEHYATSELDNIQSLSDESFRSAYVDRMKNMFREIALHTDGTNAFYFRLNPEYSTPTAGFYTSVTQSSKTFTDLTPTDLTRYPANDTTNVGWYYAAANAGKGVWMEPYTSSSGGWVISYVMPFYSSGALAGIIGIDLDFSYVVNVVEQIQVYENGYALLVNTNDRTVYNALITNTQHLESNDPHTKASASLKNGMSLEVRADYKDIQSNIHPILYRIVGAFLLVLAGSIVYTVIVTNRIVTPLKKLTLSAQSLLDGSPDVDLDIESNDEIGTLAKVLRSTYSKLREYMAYINALAYRDSLTGIKNRTAYIEAIQELEKKMNLSYPSYAVLVADINDLKKTNDQHGHDVGNELIRHTARLLCDTFQSSPVFRIGGDEFVVILEGGDLDGYQNLLRKLDEACGKDYISVRDNRIPISVARGIAVYDASTDTVFNDVFSKADHAMYMHKQSAKSLQNV